MRTSWLLALALLAPTVPAQVTQAEAVKAAKTAAKAQLAVVKSAVKTAREVFLADVVALETKVKAGSADQNDLDALFDSAVSMQETVQNAVQNAEAEFLGVVLQELSK